MVSIEQRALEDFHYLRYNLGGTGERPMANMLLPIEERNLTPDQVEDLDRRRHIGLVLQTIAGQFLIVSVLLTVWAGQDLVLSPWPWKPMVYYCAIAFFVAVVCGLIGKSLRRGCTEFSN
jgi:hypothetical protein